MTLPFDAIASQFDDQRGLPVNALRELVAFVGRVSPGKRLKIIEPGIGTGRISLPLATAGHVVVGVDTSQQMLDVCLGKAQALRVANQVQLARGDAADLPVEDDSCDVGVFASLLYLVPHWEAVLDEFARVVRPGGAVIQVRERTVTGAALQRWDAAWRGRIERAGATHASSSPTDDEAEEALRRRWPDVTVTPIASWSFGQTVASALEGYSGRLRALYPSVGDDAWNDAVDGFLAWANAEFPDQEVPLGGEVVLELVTAWT